MDQHHVERLYREYHARLVAYLSRIFGGHDAADIASQTFVKILSGKAPDPNRDPWPWLRRVAMNIAFDQLRAAKRADRVAVVHRAEHVDEGDVVDRLVVRETIQQLAPAERQALLASADGVSAEEAASLLGRTKRATYCLTHRAKARARMLLEAGLLPLWIWLTKTRWVKENPAAPQAVAASFAPVLAAVLALGLGAGSSMLDPHTQARAGAGSSTHVELAADVQDLERRTGTRAAAADLGSDQQKRSTERISTGTIDAGPAKGEVGVEFENDDRAVLPNTIVYQDLDLPGPIQGGRGYVGAFFDTDGECGDPEGYYGQFIGRDNARLYGDLLELIFDRRQLAC